MSAVDRSWADGYLTGYGYVHDAYPELNPAHLQLALVNMGHAPPVHDASVFSYCELGFGQGVTLNLLAACHPRAAFFGNDILPEHLRFAQTLAAASGAGVELVDDAFDCYAMRDDLPPFDYIVAHGVWSWVSPQQWPQIARFVERHLKPGGVFYVSYNTLPGWARFAPVRELIATVAAETLPQTLDRGTALTLAAALVRETMAQQTGYFAFNPQLQERLERVLKDNPHYLAHEYLNRHWTPTYSHQVAAALDEARVQFACTADLRHQLDFLHLPETARAQLARIPSARLRETLRDFHMNCQFRRDLFVKGDARLTRIEQRERLLAMAFALRRPRSEVQLRIDGLIGGGALTAAVYEPVLDALAARDAAAEPAPTLAELLRQPVLASLGFDAVYQALFVLSAKGDAAAVTDSQSAPAESAQRLNAWIVAQSERNLGLATLADPLMRCPFEVDQVDQLFLTRWLRGLREERLLLEQVDSVLHATGRPLRSDDGAALTEPGARTAQLRLRLRRFADHRLPLLRGRGVLPSAARPDDAVRAAA